MKRRLRKKMRLREFQEFGFEVTYRLVQELSSEQQLDLLFEFVEEAIEANGLMAAGGGGNPASFFVVSAEDRKSAAEPGRQAVEHWLTAKPQITEFSVGPLRDAWHGWGE
ncbi:MAG: 50S ribosome-binding protein YggL [Acidobacteriota bacterium]